MTLNDAFGDLSNELRDVIYEMGYDVNEQELHEIEEDLRLLEENADTADSQIFSCLLKYGNDLSFLASEQDESIQNISDNFDLIQTPAQSSKNVVALPPEFDNLISYGFLRLTEVYEEIKKYEKQLAEENMEGMGETSDRKIASDQTESFVQQQSVIGEADRNINTDKPLGSTNKENIQSDTISGKKKINPKEEAKLLNKILRENAIRPTKCPEPGRLPFKYDHRLRLEQYRQQWARQPPPNEQKRMALRWRVREFMLRRDIPHLRLIDNHTNDNNFNLENRNRQAEHGWKH